jgi:hypothetical protein
VVDRIKHERIPLKRRARVYVGDSDAPSFEMHCLSRDLSISGVFLNTECLLRVGTVVQIDLEVHPEEWLSLNGGITRRIEFGDREHAAGFAVEFGELSDRSHETLLRYFLTDKVVAFYQIFLKRFPHLRDEMSEQDAALIVNLWEDNRHSLVSETHNAPVTHTPRIFEAPNKRPPTKPLPVRPSAPPPKPAPVKIAPPVKAPLAKPVIAKPIIAKPPPPKPVAVAKSAPPKPAPVAAVPTHAKKRAKAR